MKYPAVNSRKSKILSLLLALLLSNRIMAADNPFQTGEVIIKQSVAIDDEGSGDKAGAKAETGQNFPLKENFTSGSKTFAPVIVSSRSELLKKIAELKNGGGRIYLKGGVDYGDLSEGSSAVVNARNLSIATEPGAKSPAVLKRIRIHNSDSISVANIKFIGPPDKPAIETSSTGNLTIAGNEIAGGYDGILVKGRHVFDARNPGVAKVEPVQNVRISGNHIHGLRRDAIHVKQAVGVFVSDNRLGPFHPNYQGMTVKQVGAGEKIMVKGRYENRDHSDAVQITDSAKIAVTGNTINAAGGAWNQSIFIKMEENRKNNDWIKVSGNRIFNDHVWGIRIHGFSQANQAEIARANLLQKISTLGSDKLSATKPLVKVD